MRNHLDLPTSFCYNTLMSSRLESPESAPDDPVDAIQRKTEERIGGVVGNVIGFVGATTSITAYGVARIGREIVETGKSIRKGLRREDFGNNATTA